MARFARDRGLVEAITDGLAAVLDAREADGTYRGEDLVHWLETNRPTRLAELYDLYRDCADPEATALQQLWRYLHGLGQVEVSGRRTNGDVNGAPQSPFWEASERRKVGLAEARRDLFGPGGFFDRVAAELPVDVPPEWFNRVAGMFENDPGFAEVVRLGRQFRESDRPPDDGP